MIDEHPILKSADRAARPAMKSTVLSPLKLKTNPFSMQG